MAIRFLLLFALMSFGNCGNNPPPSRPNPAPVATEQPTQPTPVSTVSPSSPVIAQPCATEGDVTPAIYEALAKGQIHSGGGCIRSWLTVEGELKLGAGIYQIINPILLKSNSSLTGSGWNTIILESTEQFTVISAYNHAKSNGASDSNITLKDFRISGANPKFDSAAQAVSLGNCVNCAVNNLWLDRTRSIGIQLGGGDTYYGSNGQEHLYAKNSSIKNCLLIHVASQSLALVNGENIEISNNKILQPGQVGGPGASSIDLEINGGLDRLLNVRIINNLINHQDAEVDTTGNGIIVNSGDIAGESINVLIDGNTIIGGHRDPPVTNKMSNGIYLFGAELKNVTITHNKVTRTGQSGISLEGSNIVCEDNELDSVGGGGTEGFRAMISNSRIQRNSFVCAIGPCDNTMTISGAGNTVAANSGWVTK